MVSEHDCITTFIPVFFPKIPESSDFVNIDYFFKFYIFISELWEEGRKKRRETSMGHLSYAPRLGPHLATQECAQPGIQTVTFCFAVGCPTN